ncbi:hypothetical protein KFK09_014811 [Dendrobium nobile]|uniref:DUF4283 domain-containing protein n=1 Tax=Dendrobium nobile TaxID=94219 RepID=A0A8T3B461_DENNO|nr:hypothetical protein KFK09_014811 [Dendrobium nobile]
MDKLRDPGFLNGASAPLSFKEALAGSSSPFPDLKVSSHRGLPALFISEEEVRSLVSPFDFALVGRFPGRRPSVDAIRKFCFNLKLIGDFSVTVLNHRNVLIKLVNDFDYCRIFSHRSYFVQNCFMKVVKWSPNLDIEVDSPFVPVWISFPLLRPHLFSPRILLGLGSIFGRPLKSDLATAVGSRPSMARILVELDVTKKHAEKIWVGSVDSGYVQNVIFEDIPHFCSHCNSLGHHRESCSILHPSLKASKNVVVGTTDLIVPLDENLDIPGVVTDALDAGGISMAADTALVDNSDGFCEVLPSVQISGCSPAIGISPVIVAGATIGPGIVDDCLLLGLDGVISEPETAFLPTVDGGLDYVMVVDDSVDRVAGGFVSDAITVGLSPNALPFFPPALASTTVDNASDIRVAGNPLIEVPVIVVDSQSLANRLGDSSGVDIRSHLNWLEGSSEYESESEFSDGGMLSPEICGGSDPGNDFTLVGASSSINVASRGRCRGRFRGRGRRRR